jgi:sortase A
MIGAHRHVRRAAYALLTAGVLAIVYAAFVVIDARIYQTTERRRFERARAAAPVASAAVLEGALLGQIQIRRLGLTAAVAEGDSAAVLQRAVGHLAETALPGESGNVVLAAHRDTFFRPLQRIRLGDAITLRTMDGDFDYVVESTAVVSPEAVDVLRPTSERTLTLVTCFPFGFVGPAPNRFIVRAHEAASARRAR